MEFIIQIININNNSNNVTTSTVDKNVYIISETESEAKAVHASRKVIHKWIPFIFIFSINLLVWFMQ